MEISIVIPLYNKSQWIVRTIQTVLNQRFQDFEIIVVDDGSTDDGPSKVKSIGDCRIRLVCQSNAGVSAARNRGIEEARGNFVAFLDADDEWHPDYLVTQMSLVENYPACDVFATNYEFRNAKGQITPTILHKLPFDGDTGILSNYFEVASCSHPPICSISIMVKRTAIQDIGGFPVGIKSGEDLLTWARLAVRYKIAFTTIPVAIYNLGEGYDKKNLPPRRQDKGDPVGKGLIDLYRRFPKTAGLRKYISHWHKMRASVAIRYDDRKETLYEVAVALKYNVLNIKVMPFMILAFLPKRIRHNIITRY